MKLTSIGSQRNRGVETHVAEGDPMSIRTAMADEGVRLRISARGDRRYTVLLTPEEVVEAFLVLHASGTLKDAALKLTANPRIPVRRAIPEVVKQLTQAAIELPKIDPPKVPVRPLMARKAVTRR